ncbi:MAG: hypothetical protein ACUVS4_05640 [Chloroflexaceae bacterium]
MQIGSKLLTCPNCGAEWPSPTATVCQVCHYAATEVIPARTATTAPRSAVELHTALDDLLNRARRGGLSPETILQVLQDELAFAADLAQPERRHLVQILDLGPQELGLRESLGGNRRTTLPARPVVAQTIAPAPARRL